MYKRLYIMLLFCLVWQSCSLFRTKLEIIPEREITFPLDWIGHYEGELLIFNQAKDTISASMELIIDYPDKAGYYPWTLVYNKEDIRAYGLETINPDAGHYRIDEFNTIKLDAYYKGGHFVSSFEVLGSDLLIDYCLVEEGIMVQLYILGNTAVNTTGGEKIGEEVVPKVKSYELLAFQKALLLKKEDAQ